MFFGGGFVGRETCSIQTGSPLDLIESVLGDWVESDRGNWESGRFGLVAVSIGDESELESFTVGVGERYGSLRFNSTIGTTSSSGFGDSDAIAGFHVIAESSVGGRVYTGVTDDGVFYGVTFV